MIDATNVRSTDLIEKSILLEAVVRRAGSMVVAYSGGVDSAYLAHVSHSVLGEMSLIVTADSPSIARAELQDASTLAADRGWNHLVVQTREVERESYRRNAADRCYWCKIELFEVLAPIAAGRGAVLAVGTNVDDLSDYRPGVGAAEERSVVAPLVEAGMTKLDVRALAAAEGLRVAYKPATPCLASRIAHGIEVTPERLARVERAEDLVRALGFTVFRVRDHGEIARIEVPAHAIQESAVHHEAIVKGLQELGWRYITLDLKGFRSGSMNPILDAPKLRPKER